jgi:dGTPase
MWQSGGGFQGGWAMIQTREDYEDFELSLLAPYGQSSRASRGRVYPEREAPYRTAFARDRDRVLHTTAFRRLEYKTQVFVNSEGDHYRTRLTHTLEVAQIGRSLARALRVNEDLVEAVALSHDLGHTPFGHAGEQVLDDLMAGYGGFEHNRQSLRIVEKLEKRYPDFHGLNLTWEVREGIVKHKTDYDRGEAEGYDPALMPTVESQIVNLADEIAYNSHDLDDGLRAEVLRPSMLKEVQLWVEGLASIGYAPGDLLPDLMRYRIVRLLINLEIEDLIRETDRRLTANEIDTVDKVRRLGYPVVDFSPAMKAKNAELKAALMEKFYLNYRLIRRTAKARRIITRLFEAYEIEPKQLPPEVQGLLDKVELHQVICDYIAGMTDRYAAQEYGKLFDAKEWAG